MVSTDVYSKLQIGLYDPATGEPVTAQKDCIERFNRTCREEVLDLYLFGSLAEARAITEEWLEEYNAIAQARV